MHLNPGSLLQGGKYRIEKVLGQGGFGITYLAVQTNLKNRKVAVKEFFLKQHCERNSSTSHVSMGTTSSRDLVLRFKDKFIKEAETISELRNHHIITIHDVFEENGTAYYVMEYLDEGCLSDRIPADGMAESEALTYIRQIADALSYIHQNKILHLDIKPSNILFRKADEAVLIDFGISKHYDDEEGSQTSSTPVGVSEGYAPTEQYEREGVSSFAASTDIYSLGATLYCLLSGHRPPKASIVLNDGLPPLPPSVSSPVRNAVEKAMSPRRKDRPQTVSAFLRLLEVAPARRVPPIVIGEETQLSEPSVHRRTEPRQSGTSRSSVPSRGPVVSKPVKPEPMPEKPRRRGLVWGIIAGVVAVIAIFLCLTYVPQEVQQDKNRYDDLVLRAENLALDDSSLSEAKAVYDSAAVYESRYATTRHSGRFDASASQKSLDIQSKMDEAETLKRRTEAEARKAAEEKRLREERERKEKEEAAEKLKREEEARKAAERRRNETSYSNGVLRVKGVEYPMVYVSGGSFYMGATSEQGADAYSDEKPVHRVTLSGYSIGKYEVTQELWEAVMGNNPSHFKGARRPVENVSWDDCQDFIRKLNSLTGQNFRLPTEAEWEFAARGGNNSRGYKYSGSNTIGNVAWYADNIGSQTHDVGGKSPNELGIYDMSGNVCEWCYDRKGDYNSSSQTNPKGPGSGSIRVYRGGGWRSSARNCRVSNRSCSLSVSSSNSMGFRLCL